MVVIRDFGPGFAPAEVAKVFEPHVRLQHGQMKNLGGSGLELGLARDTIHQFNGNLQLANPPRGGLVVTITLHLQEAP